MPTRGTSVLLAVGVPRPYSVPRVDQWQSRLAALEDRLAGWAYRWIEAHPSMAEHLERRLHAYGLHGPSARHLLRTRVVPIAGLVAGLLVVLFMFVVFRLCLWALRRRPHQVDDDHDATLRTHPVREAVRARTG